MEVYDSRLRPVVNFLSNLISRKPISYDIITNQARFYKNDFNNAFLGNRKDAHKNILDMVSINVIMKERTPLYANLKLFKTITKDCV